MGPINTVGFPVFFWANVKFLFTVTVNKIISLNTLKDGSTLKTQNSEGYVKSVAILPVADHLPVLL